MSEKNIDIGKFKEIKVSQPEDLKLLQFIFKKYLTDKELVAKVVKASEKEDQDDMLKMLLASLKQMGKGRSLEGDLRIFVSRNNMLESVMRWLGFDSKEKLIEEYNLQASAMGIKGGSKEKSVPPKNISKN